jgi:hypothetical protein
VFDCPKTQETQCRRTDCKDGYCILELEPAGKVVSTGVAEDDCLGEVCDAEGNVVTGPLDSDEPFSTACDEISCKEGQLVHAPRPAGSECSDLGATCDGAGTCVGKGTIPCSTLFDCPDAAVCHRFECDQQVCVDILSGEGSPLSDPYGNCKKKQCDAAGNPVEVPDDEDIGSDGNDCTAEFCSGGVLQTSPRPVGHPCRQDAERYCSAQQTCVACPLPSITCEDYGVGEPNDVEAQAYFIDFVSDDDDDGYTACGLLKSGDVDWWRYDGRDVPLKTVDPVHQVNAPGSVKLCAYFKCLSGTADVVCPEGTTGDTTASGLPGCCGTESGKAFGGVTGCQGRDDDDIQVWFKVENTSGLPCLPYELEFHY